MDASNPFQGLPDALKPNPPPEMPRPQEPGDAMAKASPFTEALNIDAIIANLTLDRPLKLFVPKRELYPEWEFRIINSIPQEIAAAHNKGWKEVTDPALATDFTELVAGTDKNGKAFRPILCARPKAVGDHIRKMQRGQLASLYAGMDPKNKEFTSKYAENIKEGPGKSVGQFEGSAWRIRVK